MKTTYTTHKFSYKNICINYNCISTLGLMCLKPTILPIDVTKDQLNLIKPTNHADILFVIVITFLKWILDFNEKHTMVVIV